MQAYITHRIAVISRDMAALLMLVMCSRAIARYPITKIRIIEISIILLFFQKNTQNYLNNPSVVSKKVNNMLMNEKTPHGLNVEIEFKKRVCFCNTGLCTFV